MLSAVGADCRVVERRHLECLWHYRNARAAVVPVLLTGCGRGGQRERAAL